MMKSPYHEFLEIANVQKRGRQGVSMEIIKWLSAIIFAVVTTLQGYALSSVVIPTRICDDIQLVSDGLQAALKLRGLEYADAAWPRNLATDKVAIEEIPKKVLSETNKWIRIMIKNEYIPKEPNEWLVGIRKPLKEDYIADYLVMRYCVGSNSVQIQENGVAVCLLIDVNDPNLWRTRAEDFLVATVNKFLNFPADKLDKLTFRLDSFAYDGQTVFYGTMDCDFDFESRESWEKRVWWNHTYVWTDGKRAYFGLVERDGKPVERNQAKPGPVRRFHKKVK